MSTTAFARIGFGQVRHTRLRPQRHAFAYATFFVMLPMRRLADPQAMGGLAVNRRAAISFHEQDHGDGRPAEQGGALAWLEELLASQGIDDCSGEVWLHTFPRMLGYVFKPVSFWYCHRADGRLRAVLAEVNSTFGERHVYLLDAPRYGVDLHAEKCMHVSPFCRVEGSYRFRFMRSSNPVSGQERTVVRVDYDDAQGPLLQTSVSGQLQPVSPANLRRALWRYPAMTLMVMVRIHWQALQLWLKGTGFSSKPAAPRQFVTRQQES
jgi:uncharacterized protein